MRDRNRRRLATVVLAPAAALVAWAIVRLLGIDLVLKEGDTVGPVEVFVAALVGALAGWLVVRLVERHSRNPRALWAFVGSTALAISTIGPSWLADGASAVALIALHFVTRGRRDRRLRQDAAGPLLRDCLERAQRWPEGNPAR